MRIQWDNIFADLEVEQRLADIFDAEGNQWRRVIWCDTETGELERHVTDVNGYAVIDRDGKSLKKNLIRVSSPLRIEWKEQQNAISNTPGG